MTHKIKILKQFADEIHMGNKTFEVRKNDRGYQKGDCICFDVIDEYGHELNGEKYTKHPIVGRTYRITYVLSGWGIEKDYVVFSFCKD
ncbi:MAG: DUF3850 domain-containing protein [Eubacterium sp.]|nr:DUF3850 domain-containing protein [Eubacterium sp.]